MSIPKGYKLVPVVPTAHMIDATVADDQGAKGLRAKIAVDAYNAMLAAAPTPPQPIYDEAAELNRLFGAAKEMLRIAGIANQGSNAYNRAIVNLHEAVTACAQSRAKTLEVGHE